MERWQDADPLLALTVLRAFLGFTFTFAGLQKLSESSFFDKKNPTSIQAQMAAARHFSPIRGLIGPVSHHAVFFGVIIALGELAVGLGILTGVASRVAAVGGMLIALSLWLAVSWNATPWYTSADLVYLFALTPILIGGPGPFTLLDVLERWSARRELPAVLEADPGRRQVLAGGVAVAGLALAGLAAGLGRALGGGKSTSRTVSLGGGTSTTVAGGSSTPTTAATGATTATTAGSGTATTVAQAAGKSIGAASKVPVGSSATFTDPGSGDPAVVIQPKAGEFLAFDAVCPHAGCTVAYASGAANFQCPCHGSQFDGTTGAVLQGPAPTGLKQLKVTESGGELFVV